MVTNGNRLARSALVLLAVAALLTVTAAVTASTSDGAAAEAVMPEYDADGQLLLPESYRRWVFVGSSLGLSYSEGELSHEMFHETLIEPSAYRYFTEHGEFRDGTMLVLMLHGTGEAVLPGRQGRFADEIHGVEMAVKDSRRVGDGSQEIWAYYGFGGMSGIRDSAEAFPASACHSCHLEHAAQDNVFLQFYPLLVEAGPPAVAEAFSEWESSHLSMNATDATDATVATDNESSSDGDAQGYQEEEQQAEARQEEGEAPEREPRLAVGGLDPVLLTEGREELGKPEITATRDGYSYQFVSEPTRARFVAEPERFSIQNETCLVVPGAPANPELFAVHEAKIYVFATPGCVEDFRADPTFYLPSEEDP